MEPMPNPPEKPHPKVPQWRKTLRRYIRVAAYKAVCGAAYGLGAGAIGLLVWWIEN